MRDPIHWPANIATVVIVGGFWLLAAKGCDADAAGKQSGDVMPRAAVVRDEAAVAVRFALDVNAACRARGPIADPPRAGVPYTVAGCVQGGLVVLPHPCVMARADRLDGYARLACHELQHAAGWPGDHPVAWAPSPAPQQTPEYWRAYWTAAFAAADAAMAVK